VLLVFVGTIADFAGPVNENRTCMLLRASPLLSSCPVVRRNSGSLTQSGVNRVRSNRPNSRRAAATPFCRG
jgi:hypothetical protein